MPPASGSNFEPLSTMDVNTKKEILQIIDDLEKHLREFINRIRMMLIEAPTLAPPPSLSALAPSPPPHTLTPSPSPPTLANAPILSTVAPVPSPSTLTSSPSPPTLAFTSSPSTLAPATLPPTLAPGTFPPTFAPAASSSTLTPASFLSTPAPAPSPPSPVPRQSPSTLTVVTSPPNPALTLYSPTLAPVQSLPTSAPGLSSSTLASTPSPSTLAPTPSPPILAPTQSLPTLAPVLSPSTVVPAPSSLSPPSPVLIPAQPMLEVTHEAVFSMVHSSRDFFLHTVDYAQVEDFYVKFNSRYSAELKIPPLAERLKTTNVAVKQLVCVRSNTEQCFYRGQILKANDDGSFLVRCIDFGDFLTVQPDVIFTLHEEFCSQPAMAVHCYIDGKWDQCNAMFDTLILSFDKFPEPTDFFDAARVTIYPRLVDGSKYPVSVEVKTRAGQNWKELLEVPLDKTCVTVPQTIKSKFFCFKDFLTSARLTEENFDERSPEGYQQLTQFFGNAVHLLKLGEPTSSVSKLRCIYVACVSRFVLVAEGAADLVTNMSLFYWGNLERPFAGTVNPGSLVVFALKRFFFRGLVMKSSFSANIEVYAIDLGFTVSVPVSALRPLFCPLFSLERLPPKALIAGLERITSSYGNGQWQSIAIETVKSIAVGREVVIVPSRFEGGTYAVDLTSTDAQGHEQNAIRMLKMFKLAKDIA